MCCERERERVRRVGERESMRKREEGLRERGTERGESWESTREKIGEREGKG